MTILSDNVTRVLHEVTGTPSYKIQPDMLLSDLGISSLEEEEECLIELEATFDIDIPDASAEACRTVSDVIALVAELHKGGEL